MELEGIRDRIIEIIEGMIAEGHRHEGKLEENRRQLDNLTKEVCVGRGVPETKDVEEGGPGEGRERE